MHLTCPHCHNAIEIVTGSGEGEVVCPSCGSTFRMETESTGSWRSLRGRQIGRFDLEEVVGSGAFGTVYRARDPQLDRTVAIKVPRARNLGEGEDLDRFVREGRSVAKLSHPSIVPVHEVGLADGIPYLVSEFVEGPSLSDVLTSREFSARQAAELVATIADALQFAHERGVIHRDVKPSNILFDAAGKPHVMDFGLAKREADEITLTEEGQVLGTPAYMSPEQARGEAHKVDGRSDVYSLGVVLYRLLTGELPFRGNSRMLIHQVLNDDPRTPRRLNDHIPRDLETITLKAMAKEPARRYATAGELAADLRRYLAGEPILARPIGRVGRVWRWARRNRLVASLAAALAVVFLGGFAGVTIGLIRSEYFRAQADLRRREAQGQSLVADARRKDAEQASKLAETRRAEAEANFDQAIAAVDEFLTKVGDEKLLDEPGLTPLRRELLTSALTFYERFLEKRKDDPRLEPRIAAAYMKIAGVKSTLGQRGESQDAVRLARQTYERLLQERSGDRAIRAGLAKALHWEGLYPEAIALWEALVRDEPTNVSFRRGLAGTFIDLSLQQDNKGLRLEALATYRKSLVLFEALANERPDDAEAVDGISYPYYNIGVILAKLGRNEEAFAQFQRAVEALRKAVHLQPASHHYRNRLGLYLNSTAIVLQKLGRHDEAVITLNESIQIRKGLARDFGFVASVHRDLLVSSQGLAYLYHTLGRTREAAGMFRTVRDYYSSLTQATAADQYNLACAASLCAQLEPKGGEAGVTDAELAAERRRNVEIAIQALKEAVDRGFDDANQIRSDPDLVAIRERPEFGALVLQAERTRKANELKAQAEKLTGTDHLRVEQATQAERRKVLAATPESPTRQRDLAENLYSIGVIQADLNQFDAAAGSFGDALKLREKLARSNSSDTAAQYQVVSTHIALGRLAWRRGQLAEAEAAWARGFGLIDEVRRQPEAAKTLASTLATREIEIGDQEWGALLTDRVAVRYERAFAAEPPTQSPPWYHRALLLLAQGDRNGYAAHYRKLADRFEKSTDANDARSVAAAWGFGPDGGGLSPDRMIALAERSRINNPNPADFWPTAISALVYYRAGRYQDAARFARESASISLGHPIPLLVRAMSEYRLGSIEEARYWLRCADRWCEVEARLELGRPITVHHPYPWTWTETEILHDEAKRTIEGSGFPGNPWMPLIAGRARAALGEADRAEADLAEAVRRRPDDSRVWAERGRIHTEMGQADRADADFARALELRPGDPYPLLIRAQWHAEHGKSSDAAADLARAARLVPDQVDRLLDNGWWVIGPFVGDFAANDTPEVEPDPSRPVKTPERPGQPPTQLTWRHLARTTNAGVVDDPALLFPGTGANSSYYALALVSSTAERTIDLHFGSTTPRRVWLNGELIQKGDEDRGWPYNPISVPARLRPGVNSVLLQIRRGSTGMGFFARFADSDASRGLALAEQGLWAEAAARLDRMLAEMAIPEHLVLRSLVQLRAASGDDASHEVNRERFLSWFGSSPNPRLSFWVGPTCVIRPYSRRVRERAHDSIVKYCNFIDPMYNIVKNEAGLTVALDAYRIGKFDDALRILSGGEIDDENKKRWEILALCHFRLGHLAEAQRWLDKAEAWYLQVLWDLANHPGAAMPLGWGDWGEFQVLRREARTLIEGTPPEPNALELLVRGQAHDRNGFMAEAEADLMGAASRAPDEPLVWRTLATLHRARGDTVRAEADLASAIATEALWNPDLAVKEQALAGLRRVLGSIPAGGVAGPNDPCRRLRESHCLELEGQLELGRGNFARARDAFAQVFDAEFTQRPPERWNDYAFAGWQAGDRQVYESILLKIEENAASITDPYPWMGFGHLFLWGQSPNLRYDSLLRHARSIETFAPFCWPFFVEGVIEYRRGRYEQAIALMNRSIAAEPAWKSIELAWLVLSMAHERQGHHTEAREWLAKASRRVDEYRKSHPADPDLTPLVVNVYDWRDYQILRREAEVLVLYDPAFPAQPFAR